MNKPSCLSSSAKTLLLIRFILQHLFKQGICQVFQRDLELNKTLTIVQYDDCYILRNKNKAFRRNLGTPVMCRVTIKDSTFPPNRKSFPVIILFVTENRCARSAVHHVDEAERAYQRGHPKQENECSPCRPDRPEKDCQDCLHSPCVLSVRSCRPTGQRLRKRAGKLFSYDWDRSTKTAWTLTFATRVVPPGTGGAVPQPLLVPVCGETHANI